MFSPARQERVWAVGRLGYFRAVLEKFSPFYLFSFRILQESPLSMGRGCCGSFSIFSCSGRACSSWSDPVFAQEQHCWYYWFGQWHHVFWWLRNILSHVWQHSHNFQKGWDFWVKSAFSIPAARTQGRRKDLASALFRSGLWNCYFEACYSLQVL